MTRSFILLSLILLTWALPVNADVKAVKIIPAADTKVSSLSTITVIWDAEWLEDVNSGICGRVEDENGTQVATLTVEENFSYEQAAFDLILSDEITTPGEYTVYVDADAIFNEDEVGNEPFTIKYTIVAGAQNSIRLESADPADNATVSFLSVIKTEWSETKNCTVNDEIECEVLNSDNEKVSGVSVSKGVFSTDPVIFSLDKRIDTAGTYKLIIPSGVLETTDGTKSEAVTLTYTVSPSSYEALTPIEIDPDDNTVLPYMSKFTISWKADFDFGFEAKEVGKVVDELGITVATINCYADFLEENIVIFEMSQPLSDEGEYTVTIDAGRIIASDGSKNNEIILTYTVDPSMIEADLEYSVDPSESTKIDTEEFPNIKLFFDEEVVMNISEFTFKSDINDYVNVPAALNYFCDEVELDCSDIKTPGTWTLTIPKGAFKSVETGSINPEKTYQWIFASTGIEEVYEINDRISISPEGVATRGYDEVRIYDLSGKLLIQSLGDVNCTLPSGIYMMQCTERNHISNYKLLLNR